MDFRGVLDKPKKHKRRKLLRYDSGTIPGDSWIHAELSAIALPGSFDMR